MDNENKIALVDELLALTKDLATNHGNRINDETAWQTLVDITKNNYPKCCVKYITGQNWRI